MSQVSWKKFDSWLFVYNPGVYRCQFVLVIRFLLVDRALSSGAAAEPKKNGIINFC